MSVRVMGWVWGSSRSKKTARLVLLAIADCASDDGANAYPSMAELIRKTGLSERGVQTAVNELVDLGELSVARNAGPRGCNRYRVRMETPAAPAPPQPLHPAGSAVHQPVETPQVDKHHPANGAPPQDLRPPQTVRRTPAAPAPGTVLEPSENKNSSSKSSPRGTRLSADFAVTPEMVAWARENVPHADGRRETEKFRDHWASASGANATKRDWTAAWRNWMRTAAERAATNGRASPGTAIATRDQRPSTTDQRVTQARNAGAEAQALLERRSA